MRAENIKGWTEEARKAEEDSEKAAEEEEEVTG